MKRILIVNDDGIHGAGLFPLAEALRPAGKVTVLVPDRERSTSSHALTLHKPLRLHKLREGVYTFSGTPVDCARFGLLKHFRDSVDLLVSGINRGYNMGEDVLYSGTVAAAVEAGTLGIPSFAVSQNSVRKEHLETACSFALELAEKILKRGLPSKVCLNVNVPPVSRERLEGVEVTRLGTRVYDNKITERRDPRGRAYYWMLGRMVSGIAAPKSDLAAIRMNKISVSPLRVDWTHEQSISLLKKWF